MHDRQDPLWQALAAMRIEPAGAAATFAAKLAREQGWSPSHAQAVVEEYRRFLYLAGTATYPVSPSRAVDKAWHLHLTYSRHYWDELCGRILGQPLHHDPSLGGAEEDARHQDQYARTLALYRATFGEEPLAAIWPNPKADGSRASRRLGWTGAAGATLLLAACSSLAAASGGDGGDIVLGIVLVAGFVGLLILLARIGKGSGGRRRHGRRAGEASGGAYGGYESSSDWDDGGSSGDSGDGGSSCGGGGCGGGGGD